VLTITTSDKQAIALPKDRCRKVVSPDVANGVTQILKTVLTVGTGKGLGGLAGGRPAAGKTGTAGNAQGYTNETWFAGYTPQLATAVWVGTPNDHQNTARMKSLQIGNKFYAGEIFGSSIAAPIWKQIMDRSSAGMPMRDFGAAGSKVQFGDIVPIPSIYGMTVSDAIAALTAAGFKPVVGNAVNSGVEKGRVVYSQPSGQALRGSSVTIITSTGYVPPPPPVKTPPKPPKTAAPKPGVTYPVCRPGGPRPCIRLGG
jgi:membrane peptidoglycan carboxypeptidase